MDEGIKNTVLALRAEGTPAEDIAAMMMIEPAAVDLILANYHPETKKIVKECGSLFAIEQARVAKNTMMDLCREARSEFVRMQAASFIIDEAMGYRKGAEAAKVLVNINIAELNHAIRKARVASEELIEA